MNVCPNKRFFSWPLGDLHLGSSQGFIDKPGLPKSLI